MIKQCVCGQNKGENHEVFGTQRSESLDAWFFLASPQGCNALRRAKFWILQVSRWCFMFWQLRAKAARHLRPDELALTLQEGRQWSEAKHRKKTERRKCLLMPFLIFLTYPFSPFVPFCDRNLLLFFPGPGSPSKCLEAQGLNENRETCNFQSFGSLQIFQRVFF